MKTKYLPIALICIASTASAATYVHPSAVGKSKDQIVTIETKGFATTRYGQYFATTQSKAGWTRVFAIDGDVLPKEYSTVKLAQGEHEITVRGLPHGITSGGLLWYALDQMYAAKRRADWSQHPARKRTLRVELSGGRTYNLTAETILDDEGSLAALDFYLRDSKSNEVVGGEQGNFDPERDRIRLDLSGGADAGRVIISSYASLVDPQVYDTFYFTIDGGEIYQAIEGGDSEIALAPGRHVFRFFRREKYFSDPVETDDPNIATVDVVSGKSVHLYYKSGVAIFMKGRVYPRPKHEFEGAARAMSAIAALKEAMAGELVEPKNARKRAYVLKVGGKKYKMEHLGKQQFRADVSVEPRFRMGEIDERGFDVDVPFADRGATYIFILDARRPEAPGISYFNRRYLEETGYSFQ